MDKNYGLGSTKVAVELHKKKESMKCRSCKSSQLDFFPLCKIINARNVENGKMIFLTTILPVEVQIINQ